MARPLTTTERYSHVAMAFHWTIGVMILLNLLIGWGHKINEEWGSIPLHKAIGITVLVLSVGRLAWRLAHRPPPLPADVTRFQTGAAHALHWTFYILMIALPITGWVMSSAGRKYPISWFGLFDVPFLPVAKAAGSPAAITHFWLGAVFVPLLAIHIGAALWHHFGQRDAVLARMTPGVRSPADALVR